MMSPKDAQSIIDKKRPKQKFRPLPKALSNAMESGEVVRYCLNNTLYLHDLESKDEFNATGIATAYVRYPLTVISLQTGSLWMTNYRIVFIEDPDFTMAEKLPGPIFIPHGQILSVQKSKASVLVRESDLKEREKKSKVTLFNIVTRDFRDLYFGTEMFIPTELIGADYF